MLWFTGTNGTMIDYFTLSVYSTDALTWVLAFLIYTGLLLCTFRAYKALWSAIRRRSNVF